MFDSVARFDSNRRSSGIKKGFAGKQMIHRTNQVARRLRLEDDPLGAGSLYVSCKSL